MKKSMFIRTCAACMAVIFCLTSIPQNAVAQIHASSGSLHGEYSKILLNRIDQAKEEDDLKIDDRKPSSAPLSQLASLAHQEEALPGQTIIPAHIGTGTSFINPTAQLEIALIHDAHSHSEAQMSEAHIVRTLIEEHGYEAIYLEGALGKVDTAIFTAYPDREIKEKVFKEALEKGEINGADYYAIMREGELTWMQGVEDSALYEKNYNAAIKLISFANTLQGESATRTLFQDAKKELQIAKNQIYSRKLKALDRILVALEEECEGKADVYLNLIQELFTYIKKYDLDVETYAGIRTLREVIDTYNKKDALTDQDSSSSPALPLEQELLQDLSAFSGFLKNMLFRSEKERVLDRASRALFLLEKGTRLELTRREWEELQENNNLAELLTLTECLAQDSLQTFLEAYSLVQEFYTLAVQRDTVMLTNLFNYARTNNHKKIIFITGGFHADAILTSVLQRDSVSDLHLLPQDVPFSLYSIVPKITGLLNAREVYLNSLFSQGSAPYSTLKLMSAVGSQDGMQNLFMQMYTAHTEVYGALSELEFKNRIVDALSNVKNMTDPQMNLLAQQIYALGTHHAQEEAQNIFVMDPHEWEISIPVNESANNLFYPGRAHLEGTMKVLKKDIENAVDPNDARLAFADLEKGSSESFVSLSNGNLYMNDHFVVWHNGQLYQRYEEPVNERTYTCIVVWSDGRISGEALRFQKEKDQSSAYRVLRVGSNEDISDQITYASYAQQLIAKGDTVPFDTLNNQFDDLHHLFKFPQLHKDQNNGVWGPAIGAQELYIKLPTESDHRAGFDREKVRALLRGESVRIDVSRYNDNALVQKSLDLREYHNVGIDGVVRSEGDYKWLSDTELEIRFYRYRMSNNYLAITESGKVVSYIVTGHKDKAPQGIGYTPEEAREAFLAEWNAKYLADPISDFFLISNGMDGMRRVNGEVALSGGRGTYDKVTSAFVFRERVTTLLEKVTVVKEIKNKVFITRGLVLGSPHMFGSEIYSHAITQDLFNRTKSILGFDLKEKLLDKDLPNRKYDYVLNIIAGFVVNYAYFEIVKEELGIERLHPSNRLIGYSIGEFVALAASGAITFEDSVKLLHAISSQAAEIFESNNINYVEMVNVPEGVYEKLLRENYLEIFSRYRKNKVELFGTEEAMKKLEEAIKAYKETLPAEQKKIIRYYMQNEVYGVHAPFAKPIKATVEAMLEHIDIRAPECAVVANVTAQDMHTADEVRREILETIDNPIKIYDSFLALVDQGYREYISVGPVVTSQYGRYSTMNSQRPLTSFSRTPVQEIDPLVNVFNVFDDDSLMQLKTLLNEKNRFSSSGGKANYDYKQVFGPYSQERREHLIHELPFTSTIDYNGAVLYVWPTKYCPVGCEHCMFASPKLKHKDQRSVYDSLKKDSGEQIVTFIDDGGFDHIVFGGGGEPVEELDFCCEIIKKVKSGKFEIITSAIWASSPERVRVVLDKICAALEQRETKATFDLRLSIDKFHQERIPFEYLKNVLDVAQQSKYSDLNIYFRSIMMDDNTVEVFADYIGATVTPMSNYVRTLKMSAGQDYMVYYKNLTFDGRFKGQEKKFDRDKDYEALEGFTKRFKHGDENTKAGLTYNGIQASKLDGLNMTLRYDGDVDILAGVSPDNLGHIYSESFTQMKQKWFRDIISRALLEYGIEYVTEIIKEVDPGSIEEAHKLNQFYYIVENSLKESESLRLYVTIRLIQEYVRMNKINQEALRKEVESLISISKDDLKLQYLHQDSSFEHIDAIEKDIFSAQEDIIVDVVDINTDNVQGLLRKIFIKWPEAFQAYEEIVRKNGISMGDILEIPIAQKRLLLVIARDGIFVDQEAIENAFLSIKDRANKGFSVALPLLCKGISAVDYEIILTKIFAGMSNIVLYRLPHSLELQQELGNIVKKPRLTEEESARALELACAILNIKTPNDYRPLRPVHAFVVAAGRGSRLQQTTGWNKPKALYPIDGKMTLTYITEALQSLNVVSDAVLLVRPDDEKYFRELSFNDYYTIISSDEEKDKPLSDIMSSLRGSKWDQDSNILFIHGDLPNLKPQTLLTTMILHDALESDLTFPTTVAYKSFGSVIRDVDGMPLDICALDNLPIYEKEVSAYMVKFSAFINAVENVRQNNVDRRYLLQTDEYHKRLKEAGVTIDDYLREIPIRQILRPLRKQGAVIVAAGISPYVESLGVDSKAHIEKISSYQGVATQFAVTVELPKEIKTSSNLFSFFAKEGKVNKRIAEALILRVTQDSLRNFPTALLKKIVAEISGLSLDRIQINISENESTSDAIYEAINILFDYDTKKTSQPNPLLLKEDGCYNWIKKWIQSNYSRSLLGEEDLLVKELISAYLRNSIAYEIGAVERRIDKLNSLLAYWKTFANSKDFLVYQKSFLLKEYECLLNALEFMLYATRFADDLRTSFYSLSQEYYKFWQDSLNNQIPTYVFMIPTANRPRQLERCIKSIVDYQEKIGYGGQESKIKILIVDDSIEEIEFVNRKKAQELRNDSVEIYYYGSSEVTRFMDDLVLQLGKDVLGFIWKKKGEAYTYRGHGGNRNIALLLAQSLKNELDQENRVFFRFIDDDVRLGAYLIDENGVYKEAIVFDDLKHISKAALYSKDGLISSGPPTLDKYPAPHQMFLTTTVDLLYLMNQYKDIENLSSPISFDPFRRYLFPEPNDYRHEESEGLLLIPSSADSTQRELFSHYLQNLDKVFVGKHPSRKKVYQLLDKQTLLSNGNQIDNSSYIQDYGSTANLTFVDIPDMPYLHRDQLEDLIFIEQLKLFQGSQDVLKAMNLPIVHDRAQEYRAGLSHISGQFDVSKEFYDSQKGYFYWKVLKGLQKTLKITKAQDLYKNLRFEQHRRELRANVFVLYQEALQQRVAMITNHLNRIKNEIGKIDAILNVPEAWWNRDEKYHEQVNESIRAFLDAVNLSFSYENHQIQKLLDMLNEQWTFEYIGQRYRLENHSAKSYQIRDELSDQLIETACFEKGSFMKYFFHYADDGGLSHIERETNNVRTIVNGEEAQSILLSFEVPVASIMINLREMELKIELWQRAIHHLIERQAEYSNVSKNEPDAKKTKWDAVGTYISDNGSHKQPDLSNKTIVFWAPAHEQMCGVSSYLDSLLPGLASHVSGLSIHVLYVYDGFRTLENITLQNGSSITFHKIAGGSENAEGVPENIKDTLEVIAQEKPIDLIVSEAPFHDAAKAFNDFGEMHNISVIQKFHGGPWDILNGIPDTLINKVSYHPNAIHNLKKASVSATVSYACKKMLESRYDLRNVEVLAPLADLSFFSPDFVSDGEVQDLRTSYELNDKTVVLMSGRFVEMKGYDTVLDAILAMEEKTQKRMAVVIAGFDEPDVAARLKARPWMQDHVNLFRNRQDLYAEKEIPLILTGELPQSDLRRWYALSDIVAIPSRRDTLVGTEEALGLVSLEAQSMGKPVVVSNSGGLPETVEDGKSGLVAPANDINAFKEALEKLVDAETRTAFGTYAHERVKRLYSKEKMLAQHVEFFADVIEKSLPGTSVSDVPHQSEISTSDDATRNKNVKSPVTQEEPKLSRKIGEGFFVLAFPVAVAIMWQTLFIGDGLSALLDPAMTIKVGIRTVTVTAGVLAAEWLATQIWKTKSRMDLRRIIFWPLSGLYAGYFTYYLFIHKFLDQVFTPLISNGIVGALTKTAFDLSWTTFFVVFPLVITTGEVLCKGTSLREFLYGTKYTVKKPEKPLSAFVSNFKQKYLGIFGINALFWSGAIMLMWMLNDILFPGSQTNAFVIVHATFFAVWTGWLSSLLDNQETLKKPVFKTIAALLTGTYFLSSGAFFVINFDVLIGPFSLLFVQGWSFVAAMIAGKWFVEYVSKDHADGSDADTMADDAKGSPDKRSSQLDLLRKEIEFLQKEISQRNKELSELLDKRYRFLDPRDIDGYRYLLKDLNYILKNWDTWRYQVKDKPKVVVSIIHYGRDAQGTLNLLRNLNVSTYDNMEILLLDNNSPDGFYERFRKEGFQSVCPAIADKITLVHSAVNLGYTGGNNLCFHRAIDTMAADYVLNINNDAAIEKNMIEKLVDSAKDRVDIGAISPQVFFDKAGELKFGQPAMEEIYATGIIPEKFRKEMDDFYREWRESLRIIDAAKELRINPKGLLGAAIMLRSDLIRMIGGFDTRLFMYKDENEIAIKIKNTPLKMGQRFDSHIIHPFEFPYYWYYLNLRNEFLMSELHDNAIYELKDENGNIHFFYEVYNTHFAGPKRTIENSYAKLKEDKDALALIAMIKGIFDGMMHHVAPTDENALFDEAKLTDALIENYRNMDVNVILEDLIFEKDPHMSLVKLKALRELGDAIDWKKSYLFRNSDYVIALMRETADQWVIWLREGKKDKALLQLTRAKIAGELRRMIKGVVGNEVTRNTLLDDWYDRFEDVKNGKYIAAFAHTAKLGDAESIGRFQKLLHPAVFIRSEDFFKADTLPTQAPSFDIDSGFNFSLANPDQYLASVTINSRDYRVLTSQGWMNEGHSLLVPEWAEQQGVNARFVQDATELAKKWNVRFLQNGWGIAMLNSLHAHLYVEPLPIESFDVQSFGQLNGVTIGKMKGYPCETIVLEGGDVAARATLAEEIYKEIMRQGNVIYFLNVSTERVIFTLITNKVDVIQGVERKYFSSVGLGAESVNGRIAIKDEGVYAALTEEDYGAALEELSVSSSIVDLVLRKFHLERIEAELQLLGINRTRILDVLARVEAKLDNGWYIAGAKVPILMGDDGEPLLANKLPEDILERDYPILGFVDVVVAACGFVLPGVDGVVLGPNDELIMVQRANNPYIGTWTFPGGLLQRGDTNRVEQMLLEIQEELYLKDKPKGRLSFVANRMGFENTRRVTFFFYRLTQDEFNEVKNAKIIIDEKHRVLGNDEFHKFLRDEQKKESGFGEHAGFEVVPFQDFVKASKYDDLEDVFQLTFKQREYILTPDTFGWLLGQTNILTKIGEELYTQSLGDKRFLRDLSIDEIKEWHMTSVSGGPHMQRVAEEVTAIGKALGLSSSVLESLQRASLVHDLNDMVYASNDEKIMLRKKAEGLLQKYIGVKKGPRVGAVIEFLNARSIPVTKDPFYALVHYIMKEEQRLLVRDGFDAQMQEELRKAILIEASHEHFALEVLERKGVALTDFEKWLIVHHNFYVDASNAAAINEIDTLARDRGVDKEEIIKALSVLVMCDVFENFTNKQRLVHFRKQVMKTIAEAFGIVRGKCERTGILYAIEIMSLMGREIVNPASDFAQSVCRGREEARLSLESILEAKAAYPEYFPAIYIEKNDLQYPVVTIDGPAGTGKSTIGSNVAKALGYTYVTLGAVNRAITWACLEEGVDVTDRAAVSEVLKRVKIEARNEAHEMVVYVNHKRMTKDELRSPDVSNAVSEASKHAEVLERVFQVGRRFGEENAIVIDGRNAGTDLFPEDSVMHFYLDANSEVRAGRRYGEYQANGTAGLLTFEEIKADVEKRDRDDIERDLAPLRKADDAIVIDTSYMDIEQVTRAVLDAIMNEKTNISMSLFNWDTMQAFVKSQFKNQANFEHTERVVRNARELVEALPRDERARIDTNVLYAAAWLHDAWKESFQEGDFSVMYEHGKRGAHELKAFLRAELAQSSPGGDREAFIERVSSAVEAHGRSIHFDRTFALSNGVMQDELDRSSLPLESNLLIDADHLDYLENKFLAVAQSFTNNGGGILDEMRRVFKKYPQQNEWLEDARMGGIKMAQSIAADMYTNLYSSAARERSFPSFSAINAAFAYVEKCYTEADVDSEGAEKLPIALLSEVLPIYRAMNMKSVSSNAVIDVALYKNEVSALFIDALEFFASDATRLHIYVDDVAELDGEIVKRLIACQGVSVYTAHNEELYAHIQYADNFAGLIRLLAHKDLRVIGSYDVLDVLGKTFDPEALPLLFLARTEDSSLLTSEAAEIALIPFAVMELAALRENDVIERVLTEDSIPAYMQLNFARFGGVNLMGVVADLISQQIKQYALERMLQVAA